MSRRYGRSSDRFTSHSAPAVTPTITLGMAERLAGIFPDFTIETFTERHHFDPPHRVEPERLANSLLALWQRAEP